MNKLFTFREHGTIILNKYDKKKFKYWRYSSNSKDRKFK